VSVYRQARKPWRLCRKMRLGPGGEPHPHSELAALQAARPSPLSLSPTLISYDVVLFHASPLALPCSLGMTHPPAQGGPPANDWTTVGDVDQLCAVPNAPPSHDMTLFEMMSMRVSGQEHAQVGQCYKSRQTTVWNDIQSIGLYKLH
jgi:hypothetical protein